MASGVDIPRHPKARVRVSGFDFGGEGVEFWVWGLGERPRGRLVRFFLFLIGFLAIRAPRGDRGGE